MWKSNNSARDPKIDPKDEHREWKLIESLVADAFAEQKKARRWGVIFKSLTFGYLFVVMLMIGLGSREAGALFNSGPHVALIRIDGVIAADKKANAAEVSASLRRAFDDKNSQAIILAINSPGGSPVQAGYIYDEMMRLKGLHPDKKLYAVISDLGASGGYYVAAAADQIYADKASLVGSIGVTASGFGFTDVLAKLGVERRHFTAGEHKAFLDPFSPIKEDEREFWRTGLKQIHQQFIAAVKVGRGDRVKMTDEISSGLIWNGEQALGLGLIDGLGSVRYVAREIVKQEKLLDYTAKESPAKLIMERLGVSIGKGIAMSLEQDVPLELR